MMRCIDLSPALGLVNCFPNAFGLGLVLSMYMLLMSCLGSKNQCEIFEHFVIVRNLMRQYPAVHHYLLGSGLVYV